MIDQEKLAAAVGHATWLIENVSPDGAEDYAAAVEEKYLTKAQADELEATGWCGCATCTVRVVMDAMWAPMYSLVCGDVADRLELDAISWGPGTSASCASAVAKLVRQMKSVD